MPELKHPVQFKCFKSYEMEITACSVAAVKKTGHQTSTNNPHRLQYLKWGCEVHCCMVGKSRGAHACGYTLRSRLFLVSSPVCIPMVHRRVNFHKSGGAPRSVTRNESHPSSSTLIARVTDRFYRDFRYHIRLRYLASLDARARRNTRPQDERFWFHTQTMSDRRG